MPKDLPPNLSPTRHLVGIWFFLRVLTLLWASLVSPLRPLTDIEKSVALWPPSQPLAIWLERALIAPWSRWDAWWYARIATQGYQAGNGTTAFHPLYPGLSALVSVIGLSPVLSLLFVSSIATVLLLLSLRALAEIDTTPINAQTAAILLATAPIAMALWSPYPESLFLLLAVLCIYWTRKEKWWLAGLAGALATLTRQQGLVLILPMAWESWEVSGRNLRRWALSWKKWLALALVPCGMAIWSIYRSLAIHDVLPDTGNLGKTLFALIISPSSNKVATIHIFTWPWEVCRLLAVKLLTDPDLDAWINVSLGVIFLTGLIAAWRSLRLSYQIYCLAITFLSFSYYTGPVHPVMGLPRHLLLAFPVFIGTAGHIDRPWKRLLAVALGVAGMFFLLLQYVLEAWVP
jgi:hypothetical protein